MARRKELIIPDSILDQLLAGSDVESNGLLDQPKKALAERALNAEMDHHLSGEGTAGNSLNGYGRKTVLTDSGWLELSIPRDRQSSFDPQLLAKYQRRFPGFDEKIVSMYARGMSTREIVGHVQELYGIDSHPVSPMQCWTRWRYGKHGPWSRSILWCSSMPCGSRSELKATSATRQST